MWHCGRFRFIQYALDQWKLRWPRIVITEHGFDHMGDVSQWLNGLARNHNDYPRVIGWMTLAQQWENWWRTNPGWSAEQAYFEQVAYADRVIYQGSAVEAQLLYCFGASSSDWRHFNIQNAFNLQERLVNYARFNGQVTNTPVEPPKPEKPVEVQPPKPEKPTLPQPDVMDELRQITRQLRDLSDRLEMLITS